MFHNTELVPVCAFEGTKQLEAEIFGAVTQFARTGAPGWAASTEDVEQTMLFGPQSRLVQNHDHALIEALGTLHRFTDEKSDPGRRTDPALKSAVQYAGIPGNRKQNRHPARYRQAVMQDACSAMMISLHFLYPQSA